MLKRNVDTPKSVVITDEARFYNKFEDFVEHFVIKHKETYVRGNIHTNTIEGFWSIVKGGIKGQYRVLSKKYLPFYLSEFAYRYNRRDHPKLIFEEFMADAVSEEKCMVYYKPIEAPIELVNKVTPAQKELSAKNTKAAKAIKKPTTKGKKPVSKKKAVPKKAESKKAAPKKAAAKKKVPENKKKQTKVNTRGG